jgi:hypothetical protein
LAIVEGGNVDLFGFGFGLLVLAIQLAILVYVLWLLRRGVEAVERLSDLLDDRLPPRPGGDEPRIEWPDE